MRSFIISIILLSVMLLCILLNNFYIQALLDRMIELTEDLPSADSVGFGSGNEEPASPPHEHWHKHKGFASCTVNMKFISTISDLSQLVKASYASGSKELYVYSKELLLSELEELKKAEQLSFLGFL